MFRTQLHRAALALAVAALAVTSAASTAAAAGPWISLPVADLRVTPLGLTHDAAYQNVEYRFRVSNNGPDKMAFKYEQKAIWLAYGQYNGTQNQQSSTMVKNPGESFDVAIPCHISGDGHTCGGAEVKVTAINGFDSNPSNNQYFMQNSFQP
jgi:hypothetical protein